MKVVVTGAAGFLGERLADLLLSENSSLPVSKLILVDIQAPTPRPDPRVFVQALELSAPGAVELLDIPNTDVLFHLAAIVSGHAEADLDLGLRVNFDATRAILDEARRTNPKLRFVFTSTVGVFGGDLPPVVTDVTAPMPQNSYGTAKAMSELLINDYSRRGHVDGRVVRLPTVSVRAGLPNRAVTSFASGIIREPLAGEEAICPVPEDVKLWLTSPGTVVRNILHAATIPAAALRQWRVVNLPGITVSVREMVDALRTVAGPVVASRVKWGRDELCSRIVATLPWKFDNTTALKLGFAVDSSFEEIIRSYIQEDLNGSFVQ